MINHRSLLLAACALFAVGCTARSAQLPAVEMRFIETPPEAAPTERIREKFTLNATLIGDAALRYLRPSDLLKEAEGTSGGEPLKLIRAGRTLIPGDGVVLLATVRAQEAAGGSAANVAQYTLALGCGQVDLDRPGDLKDCKGYVMRVTRTWPGEVYAIEDVTVSLIPDGGTAHGRIRARSVPGGFKAELEGEFVASIVELQRQAAPVAETAPAAQ